MKGDQTQQVNSLTTGPQLRAQKSQQAETAVRTIPNRLRQLLASRWTLLLSLPLLLWGWHGLVVWAGYPSFILPGPLAVWEQFWVVVADGRLLRHSLITISQVIPGLLIGLAWEFFFIQFHELLFPPGTWVFARTDSLIRLFPEQFWFDVGVLISGGALLAGILVAVLGYGLLKWSERSLV